MIDLLTRADEREAVATLAAAFASYKLLEALCPNAKHRPRVTEAFSRFLFRSAVRSGGAYGTPDRGAVVCAWPAGREWPSRWDAFRAGGLAFMWRMGWRASRLMTRLEGEFDAARASHVPGPHCYGPLLGVRPELQGKGLSREVLRPVFDRADRDRVPVYLETMSEPNVAIYKRLGFALVGYRELTGGLPNWEFVRQPQPRQAQVS